MKEVLFSFGVSLLIPLTAWAGGWDFTRGPIAVLVLLFSVMGFMFVLGSLPVVKDRGDGV